jgi:hypothetical protein
VAKLQDILIKPPLAIRYLPGRSYTLVVSFAGVGNTRAKEPPEEFFKIASNNGENHVLFISDISRSWLNAKGMAGAIVKTIEDTAKRIEAKHVTAIGNSMGATMALHISRMLTFDTVVALVPQFSVDPEIVPEEKRWMYFRKRIEKHIFPRVEGLPENNTLFFIVHGGSEDEQVHSRLFPQGPNIAHFILPDHDHNLAKVLHKKGQLGTIIKLGIAAKRWRFRKIIEASGGVLRR